MSRNKSPGDIAGMVVKWFCAVTSTQKGSGFEPVHQAALHYGYERLSDSLCWPCNTVITITTEATFKLASNGCLVSFAFSLSRAYGDDLRGN